MSESGPASAAGPRPRRLAPFAQAYLGGLAGALLLLPRWGLPGTETGAGAGAEAGADAGAEAGADAGADAGRGHGPVEQLCSTCHLRPSPDIMTRGSWKEVVSEMFRTLIGAPDGVVGNVRLEEALHHFQSRAPLRLPMRPRGGPPAPGPFDHRLVPVAVREVPWPSVSNVRLARFSHPRHLDLLVTEMATGRVLHGRPWAPDPSLTVVGQAQHPCHVEVVDLDGDGRPGLLVSDLGNYFPTNETRGAIIWFRPDEAGTLQPVALADGLGRVADTRAGDFDGDGDLDLVSAVFGWRTVGETLYLENRTESYDRPVFERKLLDPRHGAIHVPVMDLDADGRLDFVALVSQQNESVEAYYGLGDGEFRQETLWRAPHPKWGHSGLEPADLDGDGDVDLVLTNGDTFDMSNDLWLPYHGVRWLDNRGSQEFELREIAPLYGAHATAIGDLDGDGDLDIVGGAFIGTVPPAFTRDRRIPSLVWLEQRPGPVFEQHVLEVASLIHGTLAAGDWDGDGDTDVAVGNFYWPAQKWRGVKPAVFLLENARAPEAP